MAHEILSVKLHQLDDSVTRLHRRVRIGETEDQDHLRREIRRLERECTEAEADLRESLRRSRAELAPALARSYGQVEREIRQSERQLRAASAGSRDPESAAEEQLLLAEYVLDFAHRAVDRALLFSLKAIDAQLSSRKEGEPL